MIFMPAPLPATKCSHNGAIDQAAWTVMSIPNGDWKMGRIGKKASGLSSIRSLQHIKKPKQFGVESVLHSRNWKQIQIVACQKNNNLGKCKN